MPNMPIIRNGETYLTTQEACDFLHVSRQTINRLVRDNKLTKHKQEVTRFVYYRQSELEEIQKLYQINSDSQNQG